MKECGKIMFLLINFQMINLNDAQFIATDNKNH